MKLSDRCEFSKTDNSVRVSKGANSGETFRYRWVPLRTSAAMEIKLLEGKFDEAIHRSDTNSVLEVIDGAESCIINPGVRQKLKIKQVVKRDYTQIIVDKGSTTSGIHPTRVFIVDKAGNKLLVGSLAEGNSWYLPEGVEMGFKSGEWHFATDRYCEDALDTSYDN